MSVAERPTSGQSTLHERGEFGLRSDQVEELCERGLLSLLALSADTAAYVMSP